MAKSYRTLSEAEIAYERIGGQVIAPGFWVDAQGHVHISVPELLAYFAYEDTPANRELLHQTIVQMMAARYPDASIVMQNMNGPES